MPALAGGVPLLGICVGLQLLFEESEEMGRFAGLGFLPGRVRRFRGNLKVPHIGWNQVHRLRPSPLLAGVPQDSYAYFVHSYQLRPADRADLAFRLAVGRHPLPSERQIVLDMVMAERKNFDADPEAARQLLTVGESPYDAKLNPAELAAWTLACNLILNLDETLTQH